MSIRIEDYIDWERLRISDADLLEAMVRGARTILEESNRLIPKRSGHLEETGSVKADQGPKTVGIIYDSVYAKYIHEHLWFHHPAGGQAKFLETAMMTKGPEALNAIAEAIKL